MKKKGTDAKEEDAVSESAAGGEASTPTPEATPGATAGATAEATAGATPGATPEATAGATAEATPEATAEATAEGNEAAAAAADRNTATMNKQPLSKDDIKEIDAIDTRGTRWKAYLIRKFGFPGLQNINLVHFMGWGTQSDEYIPEPEAKILPRDEKSPTGGTGIKDKTIDNVITLYKDVDMSTMEGKAKETAEEYKKEHKELGPAASAAAAAAAAAAASSTG